MKIDWDESEQCIRVGNWSTGSWQPFEKSVSGTSPAWKQWVKAVAQDNGMYLPGEPKQFNQAAAEMLKLSPTKAYKHYRKLAYKKFVVPYKKYLAKVDYSPGKIKAQSLSSIRKNLGVVEQVYNDGLHNILPIVARTGKTPSELKAELKGKWKVIAKNSNNKNRYLAKFPEQFYGDVCDLPTTVLKNRSLHYQVVPDELRYIAMHYKGSWSNKKVVSDAGHLFRDTKRMADQLGLHVDVRWTPRRMKEEHDKMFSELNARRYPKTQFESTKNILVKEFNAGEYSAHLLESAFDIAEEGNSMGHCVAGYSGSVRDGEYLVYSVRKGGERSSTLGIHIGEWGKDKTPYYMFNQHYAKYNRRVTDETEASIPQKILDLLNNKIAK